MNAIAVGLAGGALAFAHCLGMCGGFALHLAQGRTRAGALGRVMLWNGGRTVTYAFLGALAGFAGALVGSIQSLPWIQNALAYLAGGVMIVMGLAMLGVLPARDAGRRQPGTGLLASLFRQFFGAPTHAGALALGLATGFLPCPIVLGFLAFSAQTGSVATGMATMAAMGVGTFWSFLLVGLTAHTLTLRLRRWSPVIGGLVLVLLGAATALRGSDAFHHLLGCPHAGAPAATSGSAPAAPAEPACH